MTKKCLISVVDDDQCVREGLEHLIHSMDCYEVASFASADEYLQSDVLSANCSEKDRNRLLNNGALCV
jgi:FixJ family two-component response regulator